jgi:1-deoxy-D-xylulose-5-phosphate reductoisomerase
VGVQTLDVISRLNHAGERLRVVALSGHSNDKLLAEQIESTSPVVASVAAGEGACRLRTRFPGVRIVEGESGPAELAALDDVDIVVNAMVGAAGLEATLAALTRGRTVALANKESLVVGGPLVRAALAKGGGRLLPVDSEHSALLQCLDAGRRGDVTRLILTASGGPFLNTDPAARATASAEDALRHPTWCMGARITVDSATLVNKAFEVIEAHYLFDLPYERISVVLHPESIVHSLVEFRDGSMLAQAAAHDMRIPIQYALTYPRRVDTGLPRLDLAAVGDLRFRPLNEEQFPAFPTVLDAARAGGSALAAVNAADEVLVHRFLHGRISYGDLAPGLKAALDGWRMDIADSGRPLDLPTVRSTDRWARSAAEALRLGHG